MDLSLEFNHRNCHGNRDFLYLQIADAIKEKIELGKLQAGQQLPSTRQMAERLGVSRVTIVKSYEHLASSGHLTASNRSCTFVSKLIHRFDPSAETDKTAGGDPAIHQLPPMASAEKWRLGTTAALAALQRGDVECDAFGCMKLRRTLASYLNRARGTACRPEQILIVTGHSLPLEIAIRALRQRTSTAAIENPAPGEIENIYRQQLVVPFSLDDSTERFAPGDKTCEYELIHCFPVLNPVTGRTMSKKRRLDILNWVASESYRHIIEDERNIDLRPGPNLGMQCLQGEDTSNKVVYLGALPHLRPFTNIAFVVVPEHLISEFRAAIGAGDCSPSLLEQLSLSEYISQGHMERHLHRLRKTLEKRRLSLTAALNRSCRHLLTAEGTSNGHEILVRFNCEVSRDFPEVARRIGITVKSTAGLYRSNAPPGEYLISLVDLQAAQIATKVENLARYLALAD